MATAHRPSSRPKLALLKTPLPTTLLPSELSAIPLSARTPLSAFPPFHAIKTEDGLKTPITPPSAYTDFLRSCKSPAVSEHRAPFSRNNSDTSTLSNNSEISTASVVTIESTSTSTSEDSNDSSRSVSVSPREVPAAEATTLTPLSSITMEYVSGISSSCSVKSPPPTAGVQSSKPQFALPKVPASAPLNSSGRMRLHIPASPAWTIHEVTSPLSGCGTPMSAQPMSASCTSAIRSPFSARSHFNWEGVGSGGGGPKSAAGGRYFDSKSGQSPRISKAGVRHVREIVTRTVTYTSNNTPRMSPAPKGKRRRVFGEGKLKKEITAADS